MLFDNSTGKCYIRLKNSWGEGSPLNGWTDIEEVLPGLRDISWIGDGK